MPMLEFDELDSSRKQPAHRRTAAQLLGLLAAVVLRPQGVLRRPGRPAGARVQGDGQGLPQGRHRGHPRRGLQPHRARATRTARRSASAAWTTPSTTCSTAKGVITTSPAAATRLTATIRWSATSSSTAWSYLVAELHVDGFRFDLASILGRGADGKVLDDPPLLQHIAEHPRAGRHEADRRGVGRGGPVAAGQVPGLGPLGRVERLVPRRRSPLRPRRRRRHGQRRQAHLRQPRPLRRRRRATRTTRSISSPATTASRSTTWSVYNHKHN